MSKSFIFGVPGAGKGHVLEALDQIPDKKYKIVNWGDVMLEMAIEKYPKRVKNRDDMRFNLVDSEYKGVQKEAGKKIAKMSGDVIVDTHCSIELKNGGYLPGLPGFVLDELKGNVDKLLYVTAPAEELHERRVKDPTRNRPGSVESIAAHDQINKHFLAAYSTILGVQFYIIENLKGKLESAQKQLVAIMQ